MGEGENITSIKAVAFDLDGTLYPNYRLYLRLFPDLILHTAFLYAFMVARRKLHPEQDDVSETALSFYDRQAALTAELLGKDPEQTKRKLEGLVYGSWERQFTRIKIFPHLRETLAALRERKFRLAVLSDFPPLRKLVYLGLDGFFDVTLSSETTGALKPSGIPFAELVRLLDVQPGEILYVGNSVRFDIEGAKSAGLKAALIKRSFLSTGRVPKNYTGSADLVFRDYRQLLEYVLK